MASSPTFAGGRLDRAGPQRGDEAWVAAGLADPRSRAVFATADGVFLAGDRPALLPLTGAAEPILLGVTEAGTALFAVDATGVDPAALAPAVLTGVRDAAARLGPEDAGLLAYAAALLNWHRRHHFCANCGAWTEPRQAGHLRACDACSAQHFPRTDPVVIMLVADGRDRVLLGRQAAWPPGRYSALAGFVEPGESLESAVAREVLEETGVRIADPRYAESQPWPFPASLMLGFHARHAGGDPVAADGELEDARWFTRAEVEDALAKRGPLRLPPPVAIARRLIDDWIASG